MPSLRLPARSADRFDVLILCWEIALTTANLTVGSFAEESFNLSWLEGVPAMEVVWGYAGGLLSVLFRGCIRTVVFASAMKDVMISTMLS
jgi:hypothetical protein